jgi:hypothetical protein
MDPALEKLAARYGIEPGYHDIWGQWRAASEETLRALLRAMGVDDGDPEKALRAQDRAAWHRVVPPISVLRARELARGVRIHLNEASQGRVLSWRITEEGGPVREEGFNPIKLAILEEHQADSGAVRAFSLPLPADLPEGYHRLAIFEGDSLLGAGTIAVSRRRSQGKPQRYAAGRRTARDRGGTSRRNRCRGSIRRRRNRRRPAGGTRQPHAAGDSPYRHWRRAHPR